MNRRDILKYTAYLTGAAIVAPLNATTLANSLLSTSAPNNKPQFFKPNEFQLLSSIMDTILPKTDTPSASEVGVHLMMDNMFNVVFEDAYQTRFLSGLKSLNEYLNNKGFLSANAKQQLSIIQAIENSKDTIDGNIYQSYIDIKQQSVSYYLSTEEIAENHLNYLPIPGKYIPSVSVQALNGKAWAE